MKLRKKQNKNKGFLIWITGLSGSGKTSIAKKIKPIIQKKIGPTLLIQGDNLRKIFKLNKYDKVSRLKIGRKFCKFVKFITDQNVNVIFTVVGMFDEIRNWNREKIENYIEIYIKSKISKIKKKGKKNLYKNKNQQIVGIQIKPQFPKKPDIIINNNFNKSIDILSKELIFKLLK